MTSTVSLFMMHHFFASLPRTVNGISVTSYFASLHILYSCRFATNFYTVMYRNQSCISVEKLLHSRKKTAKVM